MGECGFHSLPALPVTAKAKLPPTAVQNAFSAEGPFYSRLTGYAPRDVQVRMARAVEHAIESDGTLIVEAGTGTGKTLAYLTPAILAGRKTVVSTGTRNLQSQLFNKDLPLARLALRGGLQTALLK